MKKLALIFLVLFTIVLPSKEGKASLWDGDAAMLAAQIATQTEVGYGVIQQIQNVKNTAAQLKYAVQNARQLDPMQLAQLKSSYYQLNSVYRRGRGMGMQWGQIAKKYDKKYESYDPKVHKKKTTYAQKRKAWAEETDDSIRAAMLSHGVISSYKKRYADIDAMLDASRSADGQLAAIQAATEIAGIMAKQMTELTQLIVIDSRARMTFLKEKIEKEKSSKKNAKANRMMRDYNKKEKAAPAVRSTWGEVK